jgi:clan AA aspartic protease
MRMDGYFNANNEPAISLDVGPREIEFLLDTGFTGGLMIPDGLARDLDIKYGGALEEFYSATGEPILVSSYSMEINWLGQRKTMAVATSSQVREAILGGQMLRNCCLTIDYRRRTVLIAESSR